MPGPGRPPKYFTHAERLEARRVQRIQRARRPGAKESRSEQNRRAYLKRQLSEESTRPLPKAVLKSATEPIIVASNVFYPHLVSQFVEGEETLTLGGELEVELDAKDFVTLMGLPPYPQSILSLPNFFEEWAKLSAALFGTMLRVYFTRCEGVIERCARLGAHELIQDLNEEVLQLKGQYNALSKPQGRREEANVIVAGNKRWVARVMQYTWKDVVALKQGKDVLLTTISERMWSLGNHMIC